MQSQAELVVCFCKAAEPNQGCFATGTEEARGRCTAMRVVSEEGWKKNLFPFWKSQIWMDPGETGLLLLLQPEAGQERWKEQLILPRGVLLLHSHAYCPASPKLSHSHSRSQLVFAGPRPKQSSPWGMATSQFSFLPPPTLLTHSTTFFLYAWSQP